MVAPRDQFGSRAKDSNTTVLAELCQRAGARFPRPSQQHAEHTGCGRNRVRWGARRERRSCGGHGEAVARHKVYVGCVGFPDNRRNARATSICQVSYTSYIRAVILSVFKHLPLPVWIWRLVGLDSDAVEACAGRFAEALPSPAFELLRQVLHRAWWFAVQFGPCLP